MIVIVSGFQRCGSSLMMQMLNAGGLPTCSDPEMGYPAYETARIFDPEPRRSQWLASIDGQAVKWLEPLRQLPSALPAAQVLWMSRDHRQQAKSAIKFLRDIGGVNTTPNAWRAFEASYRRDEPKCIAAWRRMAPTTVFSFEELIADPNGTASLVAAFLNRDLDVSAMAREVRPRPSCCLPGFLELSLMNDTRAKA